MNANLDNIKNKKVLIVGLGRSGIAAAQAMIRLGADVSIQDSKKEETVDRSLVSFFKTKGAVCYFDDVPKDMGVFDMVILSPGVNPELPFIQEAMAKGAEVTGELEIAYRIGRGNFVAITGTNGKTTTTTLTGEIFAAAGRKTHVVGNIGTAVISESLDAGEDDWLVTETSSFQLETTRYFKPRISAILNITPDHLNRHHTMKAYAEAKGKIFANQSADGFLIVNREDRLCMELAKSAKARVVPFSSERELPFGAFVKDGEIIIRDDVCDHPICRTDELKIIGKHNVENALAAAAVSFFAGIPEEIIGETVRGFGGVAHRLEFCAEVDGVKYYNDSKGTNTDATLIALNAIGKDIILIAGGDAKGQNFDGLAEEFDGRVKALVLLGRDAYMIKDAAEKAGFTAVYGCRNMDECVIKAHEIAEPGDTVLLSPACASWDMYDNFEQRGDHFKDCVRRLEE